MLGPVGQRILNEAFVFAKNIKSQHPCRLFDFGEVPFHVLRQHCGLCGEAVFFSAGEEDRADLVKSVDILLMGIIAQLVEQIQHDEHTANKSDGKAENIDDRI